MLSALARISVETVQLGRRLRGSAGAQSVKALIVISSFNMGAGPGLPTGQFTTTSPFTSLLVLRTRGTLCLSRPAVRAVPALSVAALPCSSTPSVVLPASAAFLGGGRGGTVICRRRGCFAPGSSTAASMVVRLSMYVTAVAAVLGPRSWTASAHPCSSTPPSMRPAVAAVAGGGRGGLRRGCPRRGRWLRTSAGTVVLLANLVAPWAAACGRRSWRASSHPCSSTPPSMRPATAAAVGGGRGGRGRCPPLAWPTSRTATAGACTHSAHGSVVSTFAASQGEGARPRDLPRSAPRPAR